MSVPNSHSVHQEDLVAELVRLKQWFEDRRDRPGCMSQAIHIGMALDAHAKRLSGPSERDAKDKLIRDMMAEIMRVGSGAPFDKARFSLFIERGIELVPALSSATDGTER